MVNQVSLGDRGWPREVLRLRAQETFGEVGLSGRAGMLHKLELKVSAPLDSAFRNKDDVTQTPTALTWKCGPSADSDHQSDTPIRQQRTPSSPRIPSVLLGTEFGKRCSYQKRLEMQKDTKHRRKTT